jgi:hypothetical protein
MNFSRKVRFQVAVTVFVALFVVVGLQATSSPASAVNCTTSHCATVEVAFATNLGLLGSGYVTSGDGVIDCNDHAGVASGTCSEKVAWPLGSPTDTITLTATPTAGSKACYSQTPGNDVCSVVDYTYVLNPVLLPNSTVSDTFFFDLTQDTLLVSTSGTGTGDVLNGSVVISCSTECGVQYPFGTAVYLTTSVTKGVFKGWGGDCAGQGSTCILPMNGNHIVTAEFDLPAATPTPTSPTSGSTPTPTATPRPTPLTTARATPIHPRGSGQTPTPNPSLAGSSPGSSVPGATALPAVSASSSPSGSAAPAVTATAPADPGPAAPAKSDGIPWLPIIVLVVLVLVGLNFVVFQIVRGRRPGA